MIWSSPLPPQGIAVAMSFGELLGPIAVVALCWVAAGFGVLLTGILSTPERGQSRLEPPRSTGDGTEPRRARSAA